MAVTAIIGSNQGKKEFSLFRDFRFESAAVALIFFDFIFWLFLLLPELIDEKLNYKFNSFLKFSGITAPFCAATTASAFAAGVFPSL